MWQQVIRLLEKAHSLCEEERETAYLKLSELDREQTLETLSAMLVIDDQKLGEGAVESFNTGVGCEFRADIDTELRCRAAEALMRIDVQKGIELIIPHLASPDSTLRWTICGLLSNYGNEQAIAPLVSVLRKDSEADVRMLAAFALGKIGDERVLSVLQWAQKHDKGTDWEGRRVSDSAKEAIDEILARQSSACAT